MRLVVIDDEIMVRKGIITSIPWDDYGIEIVGEAADGQSGLELIRGIRPHLVLTDIRMPIMDGLEMIRILRQENTDVKFMILSVREIFAAYRKPCGLASLIMCTNCT